MSMKPPMLPFSPPKKPPPMPIYKDLHFNRDLSATKKLQAGVDLVARLLGVTLGPKGRNVVLGNKYGPPKIVNDGETVLKEVMPCFPKYFFSLQFSVEFRETESEFGALTFFLD
jgi:chaperonin GroEL